MHLSLAQRFHLGNMILKRSAKAALRLLAAATEHQR
jgi:hypothetical protein